MSVDILLIHQFLHIREKLPLIITLSYFITATAFRSVAEIGCGARGSKKVEVALQYLRPPLGRRRMRLSRVSVLNDSV